MWLKDYSKWDAEWIDLKDLYHKFLPEDYLKLPVGPKDSIFWEPDYYMIKDFIDCIMNDKPVHFDIYKALQFTLPGTLSEDSINLGDKQVEVPK